MYTVRILYNTKDFVYYLVNYSDGIIPISKMGIYEFTDCVSTSYYYFGDVR